MLQARIHLTHFFLSALKILLPTVVNAEMKRLVPLSMGGSKPPAHPYLMLPMSPQPELHLDCSSVAFARLITATSRQKNKLTDQPTDHYLTSITRTPLATHPRARQVQSGMPGSPVAVRTGASLLGRRLASRVRQHSALSALS